MTKTEQAANLRRSATEQIKSIQSDTDLTPAAKASRIAGIRIPANDKLTALRREYEGDKLKTRDLLHNNLFGLGGFPLTATEGDKQMAQLNYRDCLFKADTLKTSEEALRSIGRARITGDKQLAKAIAARAYEQGWSGVLNEYASLGEAIASDMRELINFDNTAGSSKANMNASMLFSKISETPEEAANRSASSQMSDADRVRY